MPGQNGDKPKRRKSKRRQETVVLCEARGSLWFHSVSLKCACFRAAVDPNDVQW